MNDQTEPADPILISGKLGDYTWTVDSKGRTIVKHRGILIGETQKGDFEQCEAMILWIICIHAEYEDQWLIIH